VTRRQFVFSFNFFFSISVKGRKVIAYRIRQGNPELSVVEANRIAVQGAYKSIEGFVCGVRGISPFSILELVH
jgi:hypothetical protein